MADIIRDRKKDEKLNVRLPAELAKAAKQKAKKEGRPLSAVVRDLLIRWLSSK
jgi:predicted DNA binding CopG/RHH family protein